MTTPKRANAPPAFDHCACKVESYPNGCPGCGAPQCCQRCCDEANGKSAAAVAQAGDPLIVAWMDEKHAWRTHRAPAEPGTHALMLVDDHARREAELQARYLSSVERHIATQHELTQAEASLAACRADAERLDYIERTFSGMTNRERYLPVQMIWGKGAMGRTLREACDKYMKRDGVLPLAGEGV